MKKLLRWRIILILVAALALFVVVPSARAQNGAVNNIRYSATLPPNCSATGTFNYPRVWFLVSNWNGYKAGFYWCNDLGQWVNGSSALQVNGTETTNSAGAIIGNFNSTLPATPSGDTPVLFQSDTSNPSHISAYVHNSSIIGTPYLQLRSDIFVPDSSLASSTVDSQLLGTCSVAALAQGNTAQCPYQLQLAGNFFAGPVPIGSSAAQVVQTKICRGLSGGTPCRFDGPVRVGDTVQANSSVHTGSWPGTDLLGNAESSTSGANGFWWTSVDVGTGDAADCATTKTCDGISVTTTWSGFTIVLQELRGPTAVDTSATSSYGGSGPDMTTTTNVTTTGTNDFLVADAFWSSDLCGDVSKFVVTSSPSYTTAYIYPVTGTGGIYAGYLGVVDGNAATAQAYATTETGTASCTGGGAGEQLSVIAYKTSGVATETAYPAFRNLTCLDLYQIDPNLALTCDAGSSTTYLTGVTLTAPSFFSVTGSGSSALGIGYASSGLTASENYFECVNSSGTAGLFSPSSCGLTNAFSSGGVGTGYQDVDETAAPADPASGVDRLYLDSTTHLLACLTSSGASCMPSSGSGGLFASFQIGSNPAITSGGNYIQFAAGTNVTLGYTGTGTSADPYVVTVNSTASTGGSGVYCDFNISSGGSYVCADTLGEQYPLWSCTTISGATCDPGWITWTDANDVTLNVPSGVATDVRLNLYATTGAGSVTASTATAPTYDTGSLAASASTTITPTAGDMAVVMCRFANGTSAAGISLTSSPSYAFSPSPSGGAYDARLFYVYSLTATSTTFTCADTAGTSYPEIAVLLYTPGTVKSLDTYDAGEPSVAGTAITSNPFSTSSSSLVVFCGQVSGFGGSMTAGLIGANTATMRLTNNTIGCEDTTFSSAQEQITAAMTTASSGALGWNLFAFTY